MSVARLLRRGWGRGLGLLLLLQLVGGLLASRTAGQTVEFRKGGGSRGLPLADEVVKRVLARNSYQVFVRDTILAAGDIVGVDVVLLSATLRVEGTIVGDLIAVESDVFMRPGGRIDGAVVVLNGGFYGSTLAQLRSPPIVGSTLDYRVDDPRPGTYVISAPGGGAELRLPGLKGFLVPGYDRVNALTILWGIDLERGASPWVPEAAARLRLRSARGKLDGDLTFRWPFGRHAVEIGAGRAVRSNDEWIQNNIENSASSLILGADYRNYYDAKYVDGKLRLEQGTRWVWSYGLHLGYENARSLDSKDPFSIFEYRGGFRDNPAIDDGEIADFRLFGGVKTSLRRLSTLQLELGFEGADQAVGDFTYYLLTGALSAELKLAAAQVLAVRFEGQHPSTASPPQRWRALGGWRTLPTLARLERSGDHLWWFQAEYLVLTGRRLGALGRLVPWASYAAGNAWASRTAKPPVVHNLGAGINFGVIGVGVYTDPGDDFDTVIAVGVARSYHPPYKARL